MRSLSVKNDQSTRTTLIGIAVLFVLVVALFGTQPTKVPSPNSTQKQLIESSSKPNPNRTSCADRLQRLAGSNQPPNKFPIAKSAVLGFVNYAGISKTISLESTNLTIHSLAPKISFGGRHKWMNSGNNQRFFLYPNNMVVTADMLACEILGVYLPKRDERRRGPEMFREKKNNTYHPGIAPKVLPHLNTSAIMLKCTKTRYELCYRDGEYCLSDKVRYYGLDLPPLPVCPDQWNRQHKKEFCGCGTKCSHPTCSSVSSYGTKCPLRKHPCIFTKIEEETDPTAKIVGALQTGAEIGSAVLGEVDPVLGIVGSIVSGCFGSFSKESSPSKVYNQAMTELNNAEHQMRACIEVSIAQVYKHEMDAQLHSIQTNFASVFASKTKREDLLESVFQPNKVRCRDIASSLFTITGHSDGPGIRSAVVDLLPYAVKTLQLCLVNYAGTVAAYKETNHTGIEFLQTQYNCTAQDILTSVRRGIDYLEGYYSKPERCGYYSSLKDLYKKKIHYLRNQVLEPVQSMARAINSGKLVGHSVFVMEEEEEMEKTKRKEDEKPVVFPDAVIVEHKGKRVEHQTKLGRRVAVDSRKQCLQACADTKGDCAGVDVKNSNKDLLCLLYPENKRSEMALMDAADPKMWVHYDVVYDSKKGDIDLGYLLSDPINSVESLRKILPSKWSGWWLFIVIFSCTLIGGSVVVGMYVFRKGGPFHKWYWAINSLL